MGLRRKVKHSDVRFVIILCLQMGFMGHIYHAGYTHGLQKSNDFPCNSGHGQAASLLYPNAEQTDMMLGQKNSSKVEKSTRLWGWEFLREQASTWPSRYRNATSHISDAYRLNTSRFGHARAIGFMIQNITEGTYGKYLLIKRTIHTAGSVNHDAKMNSTKQTLTIGQQEGHAMLIAAFKERMRALRTVRDFKASPVIFFRDSHKVHDQCDVGCNEQPGKGFKSSLNQFPGPMRDGLKVDKFTIAQTMESSVNYAEFKIDALRRHRLVDVTSTTSLRSDVPAVYTGWHKYNITEELDFKTTSRKNAAVAFVSNCNAQFRMDVMQSLRDHGIPVHNYGRCEPRYSSDSANTQVGCDTVLMMPPYHKLGHNHTCKLGP
jgi:hypothetical protein